jgi:O-antigen ligase
MAGAPVPPATSRAERLALATSAVFLFVAPFAGSAGSRAACLIIAALAIAFGGSWRQVLDRMPPRAIAASIAAWFLLAPLSLAWTRDASYTLGELRGEAFYDLLAFLVFLALASDASRWRMWCIALLAGTVAALLAKEFQYHSGVAIWHKPPDGGPGAFSTHLVLVAPLFVALVWEPPWGFRRNALFFAAAMAVLVFAAWATSEAWTTPNRVVWLALAMVFLVALVAARKSDTFPRTGLAGLRGVMLASAVAFGIAFGASIAAKNERFYSRDPSPIASVDQDLRPRLWSLGLDLWKEAPLLGHGFGREILADAFLPETPKGLAHPPLQHAHNAFLNIALQLGVIGVVAFTAALLLLGRQYVSLLARPDSAALGVIGLALLAGFVTKNLTDDFMHRHNAQVFWALNGMLLGFSARKRGGP